MNSADIKLSVNIGNVNIAYDVCGQGDTIIFIHGFPYNKSMWKSQADFLQPFFRVVTYDIRGFGDSTYDTEKPSMSLFADDLVRFMDALKIDRAVICGLSMGGYIALNAIYRFRNRFSGIVLCDTQCIADTEEGRKKRYKTIQDITEKGLVEFVNGFINNAFSPNAITDKPVIVNAMKQSILKTNPEIIKLTLAALAERWEMCTTLSQITVPCTIICGEQDSITPPDKSKQMAELIPGSLLNIIPGAGHFSNLEQPAVFNQHVLSFMQSMASQTAGIIDK